ncbi:CD180 antigen [Trichosurus vulpecula]|uniref:CD180 antigen n=1 Tax=Trichosurus vulpecula TaxID=9337 RepID=UPI00186B04DF|nr:CD180 antigen [Trichosurus vulpecula]
MAFVMASFMCSLLLASLLTPQCVRATSAAQMCTEVVANLTYNCENLGLEEIPESLPATTKFLEFGFNFLPDLQSSTFSRLRDLVYLDLTRCEINWVHEDAFENNDDLSTIVLTGNPLIFMADTAFQGPKALKHLTLTQTGMTSVTFIPMQNLENLETLHLGSNHLSSIQLPSTFSARNLKVLDFELNAIHHITKEDVASLKRATNLSLNLKGNNIQDIEDGAFHSTAFQSLNFGGISDVSTVLKGLQNSITQTLWLGSFHDVDDLDVSPDMLEGLCNTSVEALNIQSRYFSNSVAIFQCFTGLQELDLTETHWNSLPSGIEGMNQLKKLVLNQNAFDDLCQINAASFPNLTHLYVKGNTHKLDFGAGCLGKLENLLHLDLSHSKVVSDTCCNTQLRNLSHLQHLNLSNNEPQTLQGQAFGECPQLEVLDFSFTHLHTDASPSPFQNLHLLQVLNLSNCLVETSNPQLLVGLQGLQHLDLSGNPFQSGILTKDNLLHPVDSIQVLILSSCSLTALEQQAFGSLGKLKYLDLQHNSLTGSGLAALSNLNKTHLNLAANSIHTIPPSLLPVFSQQSIINLSHNPLDCTCSNIHFLTWYKENLHKISDPEETTCGDPPALRGVKLSNVTLSCATSAVGIVFLVLFLLTVIITSIVLGRRYIIRKYENI